jgi:hypothetical protein
MSYFDPGSAAANAERTVSGSFSTSGEYTDVQAQAGAEASATLSDEPLNPNAGRIDKVLRYPYARLGNESDYLRIEIAEFTPPPLTLDNFIGKEGSDDKIDLNDKANFQLTTASKTIGSKIDALRNLKNVKHTIYLPIPEQISDTTQISWGEGTLNPAEAFGISFGNNFFKEPTDALGNALKLITAGVGGLSNNPQLQRALQNALSATAVGALGGNVSANQLISRATGQVFNPNLELLFDGVGLRNFQFNFDFFPRDKKEAEEVILIIRTLKKRMSANRNASGNASVKGVFISAPHIFQLTYMKGGKKHPVLNSFLPMALVDLQINYTGSNTYSTFWDGTPTHMQMSLAFKELNPIYAEDYDNTDPKSVGY